MKMTSLEKRFVNREQKGVSNFERIRKRLEDIEATDINGVLELGCGIGTVSSMISRETDWTVTGTDYDAAQIDAAHSHYGQNERLCFQTEDATALSFDDASFDLVISQNVFHHIAHWPRAATEIARVLRPGGYLLWYDITCAPWLRNLLRPISRLAGVYTINDVTGAFTNAGLTANTKHYHAHGPIEHHDMILRKSS